MRPKENSTQVKISLRRAPKLRLENPQSKGNPTPTMVAGKVMTKHLVQHLAAIEKIGEKGLFSRFPDLGPNRSPTVCLFSPSSLEGSKSQDAFLLQAMFGQELQAGPLPLVMVEAESLAAPLWFSQVSVSKKARAA